MRSFGKNLSEKSRISNNHTNSEGTFMSEFKGTNVLVTGGAGFIGFYLCREILSLGSNVFIYDNLSAGKIKNIEDLPKQGVKFIKGDVRRIENSSSEIENCKMIFHLAAQCDVAYSMKNPIEDFQTNALGTLKVLEQARKMDAEVIFPSTSAVYGDPAKTPTSESQPTRPISFYGLSKLYGEEECWFYHRTYNLQVVILRIFNAYGARGHGVTRDFINGLKNNPKELRILGTGNQSRDFIYISDLVKALIVSAQSEKAVGQAYNVGSGTTISVRKLASNMIELLGLKGITKVSCQGGKAWEGDMIINHADISKIQKNLNWQPQVQLIDGLRTMIDEEKISKLSPRVR
jgi:UDP-glucose 4-epimerase